MFGGCVAQAQEEPFFGVTCCLAHQGANTHASISNRNSFSSISYFTHHQVRRRLCASNPQAGTETMDEQILLERIIPAIHQ